MNARITRTIGAVAAAAILTTGLAACDKAKDATDSATSAAGSAAAAATSAAGNAAGQATSAAGAAASNVAGHGGPEAKPAVPSTTLRSAGGTEVTITDAPILAEYAKYGYDKGHLGAPLGPVAPLPDHHGKFLTLKGGTIYWSEATGAHVVHGVIGDKWGEVGHEAGKLGYPTSDETAEGSTIKQTFQHGTITFADGKATVS
ncbi:esterase [Tsukamurella sp. NPDC003166]|uniref:LGFP repeat-containing protein n=1 Tax=Tsukamurella sp. NPDC003166 TaxID=3154444 RepID=UPI0033A10561